jgi:hypothetical protein
MKHSMPVYLRKRVPYWRKLLTEFYEDEMRRPTPHTQYPLGLQP